MPYLNFDDVPLDPRVTSAGAVDPDALRAKDMGEIGKGWASGRLGNEIHTLRSQEASLRADNDVKGGDALNARVQTLKQRQGLYAPEVGKVEDIDGFGKAASWLGGQVGQGVASSIDQMATGTALGGAATLAGLIPHRGAQALSKGLRAAAPAAMYAQSVPLMKGESYDAMTQDPAIMAGHTPQELNDSARNHGMASALLDTAVPGYMAHSLAGGGLKKGLRALNPIQHAAVMQGAEGLTETGQELIKNRGLTALNPDRDTNGDNSAYLNSFAGGVAGSSPMAAGSALADSVYRRAGDTAEKLGTKMGEGFDLAAEKLGPLADKGKELAGRGKDAVTDLMAGEDGKVSAASIMDNLKAGTQELKSRAGMDTDEREMLEGVIVPAGMETDQTPEGVAKMGAWMAQNDTKRANLVSEKLSDLEEHDPVATAHLDAMDAAAQDPDQYNEAVGNAAKYLLSKTLPAQARSRLDAIGDSINRAAGVAAPAIGRGAVAAGKAALGFGKAVMGGAKEGMAKKNMQAENSGEESFAAWRDRYYGVRGQAAAAAALANADPVETQRGDLAGAYASDMARRLGRDKVHQNSELLARHAAYTLADVAMRSKLNPLVDGQKNVKLNRLVDDIHAAFGGEAPDVLAQLGVIMGEKAAPIMAYMGQELTARMTPRGARERMIQREALGQQAVSMMDPAVMSQLMAQGINLHTPRGREEVLGLFEKFADGISTEPGMRQSLDRIFGKESVQNILTLLNGQEEKEKVGSVVDDRQTTTTESVDPNTDDEVGSTSDFDQRAAEKTAAKGAGPKVYGFHATKNLRTNSESSDMFAPTRAVGEDGVVQRPALFVKGQQLFGGKGDAIEKKIADIKAQLQEDPEYPDHDNHDVKAKSVMEVMKESNMQPAKMLALFRDYMHMAYNSDKLNDEQREMASRRGRIANLMIQDGEFGGLGENPGVPKTEEQMKDSGIKTSAKKERQGMKTTPGERREVASALAHYFTNRFVVVGEQLSNRDPSKMAVTEMLDMNKEGQGMIERSRGKTVGGVFTAYPLDVQREKLNDANILMFKGKDGEVAIPAGKLVNWVRKQRGMSEATDAEDTDKNFSNGSKDEAYLNDVMEGVATLIGTGQVTGMPYKINQSGKPEQFSQGIPESLRLATKTYGAMKFGEDKRREGRADESLATVGTEAYEEEVAADQDKQAEFFSPDDRAERDLVVDDVAGVRSKRRSGKDDTRSAAQAVDEGGELVTRDVGRGTSTNIRVDVSGQQVADPKYGAADGKIDMGGEVDKFGRVSRGDDRTELDFSKKPKDGVPDEYANQRWLSRQTGASTDASIGPEPKGTAASSAKFRASQIAEAFLRNPAEGQEMIRSRIRSAMRPEYTENKPAFGKLTVPGVAGKDQVVGGVHYIAPVAAFINASELAKANVDLSAATIKAIQSKVANVLIKGDVSKAEQVKIARLMLDGVEKVTSMNVNAVLGRYAESTAVKSSPVVAKQEAAPEVAKAGLPKGQLTPSGVVNVWHGSGENAELSNLAARPFEFNDHEYMSVEHAYQSNKSGKFDQATFDKYRFAGKKHPGGLGTKTAGGWNLGLMKRLVKESFGQNPKAAEKLAATGDATLTHTQDKGVWATEFPRILTEVRDELTPVRKLNAMAVDIHQSLEREGFAATHDSPIKHEGKFDWRAHQGKGEGNASFGAGTYLSTSDGVHRSYKRQFTAKANGVVENPDWIAQRAASLEKYIRQLAGHAGVVVFTTNPKLNTNVFVKGHTMFDMAPEKNRVDAAAKAGELRTELDELRAKLAALEGDKSPTYEVSVDIKPEQLLDWNAPLSEQSDLVQKALVEDVRHMRQRGEFKDPTGRDVYEYITDMSGGSPGETSEWLQSLGILGHKYAAAGGRNDTHPNYVIYDDAKITTNYVHFNAQGQDPSGTGKVATQAEMDAAQAEADRLFGKGGVTVLFKDITGYSGEFIEATNTIVIATTAAAGTLGTLYHEAMHKFFRDFVKGNPKMIATFESLINDPKHIAKLEALLDKYPAAKAQLHGPGSGEERLAYTYQFWKAGLLQVDAKASTWLQKIGKFFRRVLGHVRDSERALELFQAFDNGKMSEPSAAGQVIAAAMGRGGNAMKFRRQFDGVMQGVAALTMPAGEILAKSVSPTARRLSTMMFTNPGEEAHGQEETGLMNARRNVSQQYINITNRKFETMSSVDQNAVQKYLQSEADLHDIPNADHRAAVKDVRAVLDRFHQYMTDAGMKIGKVEKYYPTVWSAAALNDKKAEFIKMLVTKYPQQMNPNGGNAHKSAERIWRSLVDKEGVDAHLPAGREDGVLSPFFASQEMRTLPWLEGADKEKFLEKNMPLTLTRYFSQGAHATEYFRRFGENGKRLEVMLGSINKELSTAGREMMARGEIKDEDARVKWVSRQMRDVSQSVGAMEGSLGKDVSPNMRKFNSWMAVYQNIRVLPMALFSSFVDPLAMVARGAPMQAAYETFVYGMREVFRGWSDAFKDMPPQRAKDEWRQLAEHIGASEIAMFQHHVADEYASAYMSSGAKKINDKMFVLNGMEAWNRGNRIMATKWAVRFLEKHAGLPDKNHSERWLAELGLKPSMITLDEGKLVTDRHALAALKGISLEQATKEIAPIHDALNRWVEGAVLTPNAAQRPAWSSDPNWATLFHLKQFSYSFHQTILKRAVNEFKHGNMAPVGALAAFIPTMITADIIKGLIQGGGSLPPYMASMNAGDWFTHGVQRAGLSGIGVIGMDAANDWSSLGGPAFEQIVDAARDGFGSKSALHAMPLNSLYGRMLAGSAAAPLTT